MFLSFKEAIQVSPGFCLLTAWFAAVNGWRLLGIVLGAAAVHELGHWTVLRLLGARVLRLRIGILGAVMETDQRHLSYGGELLSILAGPGANLLCAVLLRVWGGGSDAAIGAHLILGAFNLLPVRPLDGGQALYLLTAWVAGPTVGERVVCWIGTMTAVLLAAVLGWLMWYTGGSLWLLPAAQGLLLAAGREWFGK